MSVIYAKKTGPTTLEVATDTTLLKKHYQLFFGSQDTARLKLCPLAKELIERRDPIIISVQFEQGSNGTVIKLQSPFSTAFTDEKIADISSLIKNRTAAFTMASQPIFDEDALLAITEQNMFQPRTDNLVEEAIAAVLNEEIIPEIAKHGGSISRARVMDKGARQSVELHFNMNGACSGCQSSQGRTVQHAYDLIRSLFEEMKEDLEDRTFGGIYVYDPASLGKNHTFSVTSPAKKSAGFDKKF